MTARFILGDTRDVLATLPAASVDLVFTSPPFLALRSYLPADHPDKGREIGSEPTPADFLDTLLDVVELCDRVLAPHGSLVFELGDTYSGSGGAGGDYGDGGLRDGQPKFKSLRRKNEGAPGWPMGKSLCGIPTLFAWSLAYGRNLLRPERTTEPWRIRNVVAWCRPNPPVGALGDKFRPGTSYLTVACKSDKRYFDLDAVRTPHVTDDWARPRNGQKTVDNPARRDDDAAGFGSHPAGSPPLDWWEIPTQPYKGSHYATFPMKLVERPVKAMCPERVCTTCGEPSRRITSTTYVDGEGNAAEGESWSSGVGEGKGAHSLKGAALTRVDETTGWTDCGHDNYRRGVVLDVFAGSGTTLAVAEGHGRDSIGIDLDSRNAELARERVGMWLTVEEHTTEVGAA